jgi:hypothetical protein
MQEYTIRIELRLPFWAHALIEICRLIDFYVVMLEEEEQERIAEFILRHSKLRAVPE